MAVKGIGLGKHIVHLPAECYEKLLFCSNTQVLSLSEVPTFPQSNAVCTPAYFFQVSNYCILLFLLYVLRILGYESFSHPSKITVAGTSSGSIVSINGRIKYRSWRTGYDVTPPVTSLPHTYFMIV